MNYNIIKKTKKSKKIQQSKRTKRITQNGKGLFFGYKGPKTVKLIKKFIPDVSKKISHQNLYKLCLYNDKEKISLINSLKEIIKSYFNYKTKEFGLNIDSNVLNLNDTKYNKINKETVMILFENYKLINNFRINDCNKIYYNVNFNGKPNINPIYSTPKNNNNNNNLFGIRTIKE